MARRGRSEGSVFKTPDGWRGAIVVGFRDGKLQRKYFRGDTRAEVLEKLDRARRDLKLGIKPAPERLTLATFLREWLDQVAALRVRARTLISYRGHVDKHIVPDLGPIPVAKLEPADVQRFLNRKAEQLSPATAQRINATLRVALKHAHRTGLAGRNVAAGELVELPKAKRHEVAALEAETAMRVLRTVADHRWSGIFVLALTTGLRQGEVLGLTWSDVDLEVGSISVQAQLQRFAGKFHRVELKTERSRRTLALPQLTVEALKQRKAKQAEERLLAGTRWKPTIADLVFTTSVGTPINARHLIRLWRSLLRSTPTREAVALGLAGEKLDRYVERHPAPALRFHDLRHGAATLWLQEGVSLREIMELLGHSQIALTANTYAHVVPELKRKAAAKMDGILGGGQR